MEKEEKVKKREEKLKEMSKYNLRAKKKARVPGFGF